MRRALAWCAALLLAGLGLVLTTPAASAATDPAVQAYGGCLVGQRQGDLLLLIDESASLQTNDPDDARVKAARFLISQFAGYADSANIDLDVSLAGFSTDYHEVLGWTRLTTDSEDEVLDGVQKFADRNDRLQTDYWNGLNGARAKLAAKAKGQAKRCQAVVWLSDGAFNIELTKPSDYSGSPDGREKKYAPDADLRKPGDVKRATAAALKDLCRNGGLADQIRKLGVTTFAVGLSSPQEKPDFDTMRNIATGQDSCGSRTKPVPGKFIPVSNIDDLIQAFDQIVNPGLTVETPICQREAEQCRKQGHIFVLDNSLSSVHILGASGAKGREVYLLPPVGAKVDPIELAYDGANKSTKIAIKNSTSTYEWLTDQTVVIDLDNGSAEASPWTGAWSLVFVDPAKGSAGEVASSTISISADVFPTWPDQKTAQLRSGEPFAGGITFGLANRAGSPIDPGFLLGTVGMTAVLTDSAGAAHPIGGTLGKSQIAVAQDLDLTDVPAGPATLQLTLNITTAAAGSTPGTKLEPQVANLAVEILPARGLPTLAAAGVDFGTITGPADTTGSLTVTGPGCVWLPGGTTPTVEVGPEGLDPVAITATADSADTCLKVPEGQQATLPLKLTTAGAGNGTLAGSVGLMVAPVDAPDRASLVAVPFTADLEKPVQVLNFTLALLAALILGPGIPLLLLALFKRLTAKIPGQALVAQEIPVTVVGDQVLRDGMPLTLRDTDFATMVRLSTKGSRTAEAPGAQLQTKTGWSPFGAGFVEAQTPGRVGLSSAYPKPYGKQRFAKLPLAVHNTWLATRAPGDPAGQATVLILAGLDGTGERRRRLVQDIAARLPGLMPALDDGAVPAQAPQAPAPQAPAPQAPAPQPNQPPPTETQPFSFDFSFDDDDPGKRRP